MGDFEADYFSVKFLLVSFPIRSEGKLRPKSKIYISINSALADYIFRVGGVLSMERLLTIKNKNPMAVFRLKELILLNGGIILLYNGRVREFFDKVV
ncbi:MAG: hypothetical protein Q8R18_02045 [bacterium]|nr:hypothetical protein [bacterium]